LKQHIKTRHVDDFYEVTEAEEKGNVTEFNIVLPLEACADRVKCYNVSSFHCVFTVRENTLYTCVLHIGDRVYASKYEYEVEIETQDGESASSGMVTCSSINSMEDLIRNGACAVFHHDFAIECLDANKMALTLNMRIKDRVTVKWGKCMVKSG
jgi:hypothetical protein